MRARNHPHPRPLPTRGRGAQAQCLEEQLMPDLLLELFSEEIPARMQARAAEDLKTIVTGKLVDAGLVYEGARAFATPRRLALTIQGLPNRQPDLKEEKKGPRVGSPEKAIEGFLKSAGLASIDDATIQKDPKKGDFYLALIEKPGRPAIEVLSEMLPVVIRTFPWPKSMRWGSGKLTVGAAAAFDRRDLRAGDRGARRGAVPGRGHRGRPHHARPSLPRARRDRGDAVRRLRGEARQGQGRARSRAAQGADPRRRQEPRLRARASSWSRTRRCSTRWRAWSNGRWC